jgi:hypothetical protein
LCAFLGYEVSFGVAGFGKAWVKREKQEREEMYWEKEGREGLTM